MKTPKTVIIGAGIGGLTTAALLLQAGHDVTILEAHVYPGGCAGTFYHKGFRFDAGATLAGGFSADGPHGRLARKLGLTWPVKPVDPAWIVHLTDGRTVTQWADRHRWQAERQQAFPGTESFWRKQERLADISWDVSSRPFPWPPQSTQEFVTLSRSIRLQTMRALPYLFSTMSEMTSSPDPMFSLFLDAQLLISAQTTSRLANALYGSAALDLPRRGVNHVAGGIGAMADTLVSWIRQHGGQVIFHQEVEEISLRAGRATAVKTIKGLEMEADLVIGNLTPWGLHNLLGEQAPPKLTLEMKKREPTWGAFTIYLGLDETRMPPGLSGHRQLIDDPTQPLGEGNSIFLSLADPSDPQRAPAGQRAATLSTHTAVTPWQNLRYGPDEPAYLEERHKLAEKIINTADKFFPGLKNAITLCLPGTPATFEFFTRRPGGMVGGFPQSSIFKARGPATGIPNLWLVGDSIFPGQSTAGVTLGGMRVADTVLNSQAG